MYKENFFKIVSIINFSNEQKSVSSSSEVNGNEVPLIIFSNISNLTLTDKCSIKHIYMNPSDSRYVQLSRPGVPLVKYNGCRI